MEMTSPSSITTPPGAVSRRRLVSTSSSSAPHTQVLPMPRATTAACEVLPPREVRMPSAAIMPSRSSGLVSRRIRMTCSPERDHFTAVYESKTALPTAAPGEAVMPQPIRRTDPPSATESSKRGNISCASCAPVTRCSASSTSIRPWSTSWVAIRKAAAGGALADPGLQHPQLAALDGELDVAQVLVVRLQRLHDLHQLVVRRLVERFQLGERHGVADAGDDVLALRVLQVVAVDALVAAGRVAGEGDAGAGVGAEVAEDHRADVDGGAEVAGDALLAAVELGPVGVPGVEDRADGEVHLLARLLREVPPGLLGDDRLEVARRAAAGRPRPGRGRCRRPWPAWPPPAPPRRARRRRPARSCRTSGSAGGRSPRRTARRRAWAASPATDASDSPMLRTVSIIPGMENFAPERTDTSSGSSVWPSRRAHPLLQRVEVRTHLVAERGRLGAGLQVDLARLGGDGEARRDGQPEVGHLGEVRTLAAEQILEVLVALGEVVDELLLVLACRHVVLDSSRSSRPGCPDGGERTHLEGASVRPSTTTHGCNRPSADRSNADGSAGRGVAERSRVEATISQSEARQRFRVRRVTDGVSGWRQSGWHSVPFIREVGGSCVRSSERFAYQTWPESRARTGPASHPPDVRPLRPPGMPLAPNGARIQGRGGCPSGTSVPYPGALGIPPDGVWARNCASNRPPAGGPDTTATAPPGR